MSHCVFSDDLTNTIILYKIKIKIVFIVIGKKMKQPNDFLIRVIPLLDRTWTYLPTTGKIRHREQSDRGVEIQRFSNSPCFLEREPPFEVLG